MRTKRKLSVLTIACLIIATACTVNVGNGNAATGTAPAIGFLGIYLPLDFQGCNTATVPRDLSLAISNPRYSNGYPAESYDRRVVLTDTTASTTLADRVVGYGSSLQVIGTIPAGHCFTLDLGTGWIYDYTVVLP